MDAIRDFSLFLEIHHSAAECSCCVHMDPIIYCSSSPETHHSAAHILQSAGSVSILVSPYVVLLFWEPFILLQACQKMLAFVFLTCLKSFLSDHVMELWPKVVKLLGWRCHRGRLNSGTSFRDVFHTSAFCSHGGSCPLGVSTYMHSGQSKSKSVNHMHRFVFLEPARPLVAVPSKYSLKDESCLWQADMLL